MQLISFILLLWLITSAAFSQGPINVGGLLQTENERVQVPVHVSFSMEAYVGGPPPSVGSRSRYLVGFYDDSLGLRAMVPEGTWLRITVYPNGFGDLRGVDFDPTGHAKLNDRSAWEEMSPQLGGGYSISVMCDEVGSRPIRFRIRHRDNRDSFSLLFITATWKRLGEVPAIVQVVVQQRPDHTMRYVGEEMFGYFRGFIPATAQLSDEFRQAVIPGQQLSQSESDTSTNRTISGSSVPNEDLPIISRDSVGLVPASEPAPHRPAESFDVLILAGYYDQRNNFGDGHIVPPPEGFYSSLETFTTVRLSSDSFGAFVRMDSLKPFTGDILLKDGTVIKLQVDYEDNLYTAIVTGEVSNYLRRVKRISVRQGRPEVVRHITFSN